MEAQISEGKSPVLPPRGSRDPMALEKSRKRDSQSQSRTQSNERDGAVSTNQSSTKRKNWTISLVQIWIRCGVFHTVKTQEIHHKMCEDGFIFYFITYDCAAYLMHLQCVKLSFQS